MRRCMNCTTTAGCLQRKSRPHRDDPSRQWHGMHARDLELELTPVQYAPPPLWLGAQLQQIQPECTLKGLADSAPNARIIGVSAFGDRAPRWRSARRRLRPTLRGTRATRSLVFEHHLLVGAAPTALEGPRRTPATPMGWDNDAAASPARTPATQSGNPNSYGRLQNVPPTAWRCRLHVPLPQVPPRRT
jgi:hypothetical protein